MAVEQKVEIEEEEHEKRSQMETKSEKTKKQETTEVHKTVLDDYVKSEEEKMEDEMLESSTDGESHSDEAEDEPDIDEKTGSSDGENNESGDDEDDTDEKSPFNLFQNLTLTFLGDYLTSFKRPEKQKNSSIKDQRSNATSSYKNCSGELKANGKANVELNDDALSESGSNNDSVCLVAEDGHDGSCYAEDGSDDDERLEEMQEEKYLSSLDLRDNSKIHWLWSNKDFTSELLDSHLGYIANHWTDYSNDDILKQEEILKQETLYQPLVGDKELFSSLEDEYEFGDPVMLQKIKMLSKQYSALRRIRRDGNCFFRCFSLSFMEHVLEKKDEGEYDRICDIAEKCASTLYQVGYDKGTFDIFSIFLKKFRSFSQGEYNSDSYEVLLSRSCELDSDNDVKFFRLITSAEIQMHEEFWRPFIPELICDEITFEQFCKNKVEKMGEQSDHIHIKALSDALGVSIRVVYIDRSLVINNGTLEVNKHDFFPTKYDDNTTPEKNETDGKTNTEPVVCLLYRPDHYDILYPR